MRPGAPAAAGAEADAVVVVLGAAPAEHAAQDVGERVLEVAVRHHVDHRIQRRVEVADPGGIKNSVHVGVVYAMWLNNMI